MSAHLPSVAVLGAGTMGAPIAANLRKAGLDVAVWRRDDDLPPAVRDRDVVLTMLSDADAVLEVAGRALPAAREGVLWVQASTIGIDGTDRCAELARRHGAVLVDAPVLGTKAPAEQGALVVLASGPDDALDRLAPVFEAIGQRTLRVGPAGAGTRLKLVANAWVVTVVQGAAETLALAQGLGLDPTLLFAAIEGGALDLPYLRSKGGAMLQGDFSPSFSLRLAAKDARLVAETAGRVGVDAPVARAVAARFTEAEEEHGDKDLAATFHLSAPPDGGAAA